MPATEKLGALGLPGWRGLDDGDVPPVPQHHAARDHIFAAGRRPVAGASAWQPLERVTL